MTEKKPTRREQQSAEKKALICEKAKELFAKYGYKKTTLADISRASGFSIGSLYNFFKTKDGILLEISIHMGDLSFDLENLEEKAQDPFAPILQYLLCYSSRWEDLGVDLTTHIYSVFNQAYLNAGEKTIQQLPSYRSFATFIRAAQKSGHFDETLSAEDSAAYLITVGRGLVYEWCLMGGTHSLTQKAEWFLPRIIGTFMV